MITFTPGTDQFLNTWKVLPYVELKDITVKDSKNANFIFTAGDTVNISNVYLEGLSVKDVTVTYPVLYFGGGHSMNVYNLSANNVTGPIIQAVTVLTQNFSSFSLSNMKTDQQLQAILQSIIYISKVDSLLKKGLNISRSKDTFLDNINLNVIFSDSIFSNISLGIYEYRWHGLYKKCE